ncbi:hypothetical protein D9O40_03595 [Clostridium autoethanogenum]|uniref:Uncharacterized protein n=1 Tax=Clostridium autoethanogenum TaxID=84023 RepID=A0A3M0T812_9CLOT|nr:hypothetical protein [Clostridium autoethanogenum]RMD03238.1 hypothetical protein D9O40_03595 [Clostridium autoethanogenum]
MNSKNSETLKKIIAHKQKKIVVNILKPNKYIVIKPDIPQRSGEDLISKVNRLYLEFIQRY